MPVGDDPANQQGLCLDGCVEHEECRSDYQCRLVGVDRADFTPLRVCLPECGGQLRCLNPTERCNEGRCEFPCTEDGGPGQPPGRDLCEGLGFECVADVAGEFWCEMF